MTETSRSSSPDCRVEEPDFLLAAHAVEHLTRSLEALGEGVADRAAVETDGARLTVGDDGRAAGPVALPHEAGRGGAARLAWAGPVDGPAREGRAARRALGEAAEPGRAVHIVPAGASVRAEAADE